MALLDDAPDVISDLAGSCVRFVEKAVGVELDYTSETLPILDHYLNAIEPSERSEELLALVAPASAAYFGEVIRRRCPGARWHCPDSNYKNWRIEFSHVFLFFNPVGTVMEAICREAVPEWRAHFQLLESDKQVAERAFSEMRGVRKEDFYRLAVRFDALESLLELLVGLKEARGENQRFFDPSAYQTAAEVEADPAQPLLH